MDLETTKEAKITATEARKKLVAVWDKLEFGVKERVKKAHSHRTLDYILNTEGYSKTHVVLSILETIKKEVEAVKNEAVAMSNDVQTSLEG